MKNSKILLAALIVIIFSIQTNAQWATSSTDIYNTNTGNVGISTNSPIYLLDIAKFVTEPTVAVRNLGSNGGATFRMTDANSSSDYKFKSIAPGGFKIRDVTNSLDVILIENNSATHCIYIKSGGNVGIGTNNPGSKLAVNGKIDCKEVEVTLTGWPDFVFADDYKLRTLTEVEKFIIENNHLPDVPSEKEVLENGVNVGEMHSTLLRKIEELTLYMIELKKENEEMKGQFKELMMR